MGVFDAMVAGPHGAGWCMGLGIIPGLLISIRLRIGHLPQEHIYCKQARRGIICNIAADSERISVLSLHHFFASSLFNSLTIPQIMNLHTSPTEPLLLHTNPLLQS